MYSYTHIITYSYIIHSECINSNIRAKTDWGNGDLGSPEMTNRGCANHPPCNLR